MTALVGAAFTLGTWFGVGRARIAPGTFGSVGAIPVHWLLCRLNPGVHLGCVVLMAAAGVWASQVIADHDNVDDPSYVVIDEVAGTLMAMGLVRSRSLAVQLAAFALFRLLDIWKPGPIESAENVGPKGVGIMLDDVFAGIVAGLMARRL